MSNYIAGKNEHYGAEYSERPVVTTTYTGAATVYTPHLEGGSVVHNFECEHAHTSFEAARRCGRALARRHLRRLGGEER